MIFMYVCMQFSAALLAGLTESDHPQLSTRLHTLYCSLGNTRTICRFLDDLPALAHTLKMWQSLGSVRFMFRLLIT